MASLVRSHSKTLLRLRRFVGAVFVAGICLGVVGVSPSIAQGVDDSADDSADNSAAYQESIQKLYITYYGRPADPGGLAHWTGRLQRADGQLDRIIATFATSREFLDRFGGLDSEGLVDNLFLQLFGRSVDPVGLAFYRNLLDTGARSLPDIALSVLSGVRDGSPDALIVANRLQFAKAYTAAAAAGLLQYDLASAASLLRSLGGDQEGLDAALAVIASGGDRDSDGSPDPADVCPATPPGLAVDSLGCSEEQREGITLLYRDRVQEIYVGYYGRPANPGGLVFWTGFLARSAGSLEALVSPFGNSSEFLTRFAGLDSEALINNIYLRLFGRNADSGGLAFFRRAIDEGRLTLPRSALSILAGASPQSADGLVLANRILFANAYTDAVAAGLIDYDLEVAAALLGTVFGDAQSLQAAIDAIQDDEEPLDTDADGVADDADSCPDTAADAVVDAVGCAPSQLDGDGDGVADAADVCPDTPAAATVDATGCAASQVDSDSDGVSDADDACPLTPAGAVVDSGGCALVQLDADGDGVSDAGDACPLTPAGVEVDASGCAATQRDSDGDGVNDADDACPATADLASVDGSGCALSQLDTDGDGVNDADDACPATPVLDSPDAFGCGPSQLDDDGDGISNAVDECPDTLLDVSVDERGCAFTFDEIFLVNEVYFSRDELLGQKIWAMGYYGSPRFAGDGLGQLVSNPNRLMATQVPPEGTAVSLDGMLPPVDDEFGLMLVFGEVRDYTTHTGFESIDDTPVIVVEESVLLSRGAFSNDNSDRLIPEGNILVAGAALSRKAVFAPAAAPPLGLRQALEGDAPSLAQTAKACDRVVVISGGVSDKSNNPRYRDDVIRINKKMRSLGFDSDSIEIFYFNNNAIDVDENGDPSEQGGEDIVDQQASKQAILAHLAALSESMPSSCTLHVFVSDHGTGYEAALGYEGARIANGNDGSAISGDGGKFYSESDVPVDARKYVRKPKLTFKIDNRPFTVRFNADGEPVLYERIGDNWVSLGTGILEDGRIGEAEISADIDKDGEVGEINVVAPLSVEAFRQSPPIFGAKEWDSSGDGSDDKRLIHDGERYVMQSFVDGQWVEIGRDLNGDNVIDSSDNGGIDWNNDGDRNDTIGFNEGINLLGKEVLWDFELADALRPFNNGSKRVHITFFANSCFSGGLLPNLEGIVETAYAASDEQTLSYSAVVDGVDTNVNLASYLENLAGVDSESARAAIELAKVADNAANEASGLPDNLHTDGGLTKYGSAGTFKDAEGGGYWVELFPDFRIFDQSYDFEIILGLQRPFWTDAEVTIEGLPSDWEIVEVPGGIGARTSIGFSTSGDLPQLRLRSNGAPLGDELRIEYTDINHNTLGYGIATRGEFDVNPDDPVNPEENSSIAFSDPPLNCVDHDGPPASAPNAFSTLQWFWLLNATLISSYTDYRVEVTLTDPFGNTIVFEVPLSTAASLFFEVGIVTTGLYQWEITGVRNAATDNPVPSEQVTGGSGSFRVDSDLRVEANKGACKPQ